MAIVGIPLAVVLAAVLVVGVQGVFAVIQGVIAVLIGHGPA
jgi:hypothetical protein